MTATTLALLDKRISLPFQGQSNQSISESFLTVKGAALFLPRGNGSSTPRISHRRNKHAGDLQQHLQAMFMLLRPEDNIRLAVRLESTYQNRMRYMVVVSTNGRQDTEESLVLGMDFSSNDSSTCTMGLVLPLWSDTLIHLDGDGGFSVSTDNRIHVFKPVSVQAMWSALQSLHKACEVARIHNYYPGSLFLTWVSYYESHINSDQSSVNEWNAMQDLQSHRPDSPALFTDIPTERERTERLIKTKLREIMMQKDLENITSKEIRTELEMQMVCNLREFKEFIDNEMIVILGQMDSPTQIFDHVFLGSEWNASNLEDLQNRGVRYILNVTREIDNFFPGVFEYHNIRVYDEEATDLLAYWNDTYKFISKAKKNGSRCLVHCKMGVSRSASTVIAYAMKEYGWDLERSYDYVKERRTVTKPNPSFMRQLEEYQGILLASKQRHNKLWRSHSESDLSDHHEPICKSGMEVNKKEITTSADQISEAKGNDNHQPTSPVFSLGPQVGPLLPSDADTIEELCAKERKIHLAFARRDSHTGQIEDELNLNNINGCPSGCCRDDSKFPLDNRLASVTLMQLEQPLARATEFPDLTVDEVEKDALKMDISVHLVPMEDLELPGSPEQNSASPQPEAADFSTDRIDFFSALEKFVELSQESRPRTCSHSRVEEQGAGRNGLSKASTPEALPSDPMGDSQRSSSTGNSPQASEDSSTDEEQPKEPSELVVADGLARSHSENAISVKEIITEIESINQGAGQCLQKAECANNHTAAPKWHSGHEPPVEAAWVSDQGEGACVVPQEKEMKEGAPVPQLPLCKLDLEESDPAEGQQESRLNPGLKWCPGSVRRATLEFEERLRQEQEHQHIPPVCVLPPRKNSRNEAVVTELSAKERQEDLAPELTPAPQDNEVGAEASSEQPHDVLSSSLPEFHPLQESLSVESSTEQPGTAKEHRTVASLEGTEKPVLPSQLPKRIEIIEYTHMVKAADPPEHSFPAGERHGEPGTLESDKAATALPLVDENLNSTLGAELLLACPDTLPSSSPPAPEHKGATQATFPSGSPEESVSKALTNTDTSQVRRSSSSTSLDHLYHQHVVHLEGVTQQSTSTDQEPPAPGSSPGDGDGGKVPRTGSREDFPFVGRLPGNGMQPQEALAATCTGLPHSSSSDSIQDTPESPGLVRQRAKEMESRIRQAGLTIPSQMKRSASLAKLGCLDLSKDDLAEREPGSSCTNPERPDSLQATHSLPPFAPGLHGLEAPAAELWPLFQDPTPTRHFVEQLRTAECIAQSKPVARAPVQYALEFGPAQQSLALSTEPPLTSSQELLQLLQAPVLASPPPKARLPPAPRHQQGRTRPPGRLRKPNGRKRTANPLYNTM
uniref:protein-serine/threonine phosphatase n=1 Tax=Sphenodon punctatus TaxID=8508 RepID=A0A8D0GES7_SPHPU